MPKQKPIPILMKRKKYEFIWSTSLNNFFLFANFKTYFLVTDGTDHRNVVLLSFCGREICSYNANIDNCM